MCSPSPPNILRQCPKVLDEGLQKRGEEVADDGLGIALSTMIEYGRWIIELGHTMRTRYQNE